MPVAAIFGLTKRRFVDRTIGRDKTVVRAVQFTAGVAAELFRPALVLRLQHAAGTVAEFNQRCQPLAGHGAVTFERRAAIDDRLPLPAFGLVNGFVIADEETPFTDVAFLRRRNEDWFCRDCFR